MRAEPREVDHPCGPCRALMSTNLRVNERPSAGGPVHGLALSKANKYRPFSVWNLAQRGVDLWARTVELCHVPLPKEAV